MSAGVAIARATIALTIIVLILVTVLGVVILAPHSIIQSVNKTVAITNATGPSSTSTSNTFALGTTSQCGFVTTCAALSPSGLELILAINSTRVRPNGTLALSVTELNTLSTTNNVSASSAWRMSKLGWLYICGPPGYIPHGIELFNGYYTLGNITTASPNVHFWGSAPCPAASGLDVGKVTSYAFQAKSDEASYSAINIPSPPPTLPNPASMRYSIEIYAGTVNDVALNQISSTPSTYTLVAGDEWGALVLVHFSVTQI